MGSAEGPELTILTLTLNEETALGKFLEKIPPVVRKEVGEFELLIVDGASTDKTVEIAEAAGARVVQQSERGYGNAYREGLRLARGKYILTLDADSAHPMELFGEFWSRRADYSVVMGSRYLPGSSDMRGWPRRTLSRVLNFTYRNLLWLPLRDISGGFRLYRAEDVRRMPSAGKYYDVVAELIVLLQGSGFKIHEIPYSYVPRTDDKSKAQIIKFGFHYLRTLLRLWWWLRAGGSAEAKRTVQC